MTLVDVGILAPILAKYTSADTATASAVANNATPQSTQQVPQLLWLKSIGMLIDQAPVTQTTDLLGFAVAVLFMMTERGQQAFKTVEPTLGKIIDFYRACCTSLFQASAVQPALAIPGVLLFTSLAERLMLIDHNTASQTFAVASVFQSIATAENLIGNFFKTGLQAIGFSAALGSETVGGDIARNMQQSAMANHARGGRSGEVAGTKGS